MRNITPLLSLIPVYLLALVNTARPKMATKPNKKMRWIRWSISPVVSCPGKTAFCMALCYCLKAIRMYPTAAARWKENHAATYRPDFVPRIVLQLSRRRKLLDVVRIHESGDFYSVEYFYKWCDICRAFPATKFLAYTKGFDLFTIDRPTNMMLVASIMPDTTAPVPEGAATFTCLKKGTPIPDGGFLCSGACHDCAECIKPGCNVFTYVH